MMENTTGSEENAAYSVNSRRKMLMVVAIVQILGVGILIMVGMWTGKYLGGFAWDGTSKEFNVHPLCMTLGLIFLYGNAILVYRVFSRTSKKTVKILHASLFGLAFVCAVIGFVAVFEFHIANDIGNMYSLHSWCGMATMVLFILQFFAGLTSFSCSGICESWKVLYLPLHRYFGGAILVLAGISAISGINEKLFFSFSKTYQKLPLGAVIGNIFGFTIMAFIVAVLFIVQRSEWRTSSSRIDNDTDESRRMVVDARDQ